jgi:hypothetical protein
LAYGRGLLPLGKDKPLEEETFSGASTPRNTSCLWHRLATRTLIILRLELGREVVSRRPMKPGPEPLLKAIAPYREDLVACVECLFT